MCKERKTFVYDRRQFSQLDFNPTGSGTAWDLLAPETHFPTLQVVAGGSTVPAGPHLRSVHTIEQSQMAPPRIYGAPQTHVCHSPTYPQWLVECWAHNSNSITTCCVKRNAEYIMIIFLSILFTNIPTPST